MEEDKHIIDTTQPISKSRSITAVYRNEANYPLAVNYNFKLAHLNSIKDKLHTAIYHDNNLIQLTSTHDITGFTTANGLSLGNPNEIKDIVNTKCYFLPSTLTNDIDNIYSKKVKPSTTGEVSNMEETIKDCGKEMVTCIVCCKVLPNNGEDRNRHLYYCLIGKAGNEKGVESIEVGKGQRHSRKPNKVKKIFNADVLSIESNSEFVNIEHKLLLNVKNQSPTKSEKEKTVRSLKENLSDSNFKTLLEFCGEENTTNIEIKGEKSEKKRKINVKHDEVKYCPYCFVYYSKKEKQYNVHIAKCYEKYNSEMSVNFTRNKRLTYKPFYFEPEDYEKLRNK